MLRSANAFVAIAVLLAIASGRLPAAAASSSGSEQPMVLIPAGTLLPFFKIRATDLLTVDAFLLDTSAVRYADFLDFVRADPTWRKSRVRPLFAEASYLRDWRADLDPPAAARDRPVTFVSWFAARAYCRHHGKRLPTVSEWERAAGFAAAAGAVWEWVDDFDATLVSGSASGERTSNLYCGAGVRATDATDYAGFLRYSFRSSLKANYALAKLGFRCARDPR